MLAVTPTPDYSYVHTREPGVTMQRYEAECRAPDGSWTLNISIVPLLYIGETFGHVLASAESGVWEGKWMAADGLTGTSLGESVDDCVNACLYDYQTKRLKWGRNAAGELH